MSELEETHVVTCFLRNRGEVLLLRRSDEVGSYRGRWGGVAGHAEGEPHEAARREIDEESDLLEACTLVRRGEPFPVEDEELGKRWVVHPFLFDCESRDVSIDWESVEAEWVAPPEILRRDTVPELWTSYRRVAPTVDSVASDREHGSAWLSLRALEVLRDAAAEAGAAGSEAQARDGAGSTAEPEDASTRWQDLGALAERLIEARPVMTALHNRVHRAMARADGDPAALADAAHDVLRAAANADAKAADAAAEMVRGKRVFTFSRSGTVENALRVADCEVVVAVSDPLGEGVELAERLSAEGLTVTLCPDAAVAHALHTLEVDAVLVGADGIGPDGAVSNKVGTHPLALAARSAGVPVFAVAARDKIAPSGEREDRSADGRRADRNAGERRVDRSAIYGGDASLEVVDVLFETTPTELFEGVITEGGRLDQDDIRAAADEHRDARRWRDL